jgi:hypothetical protein
MYAQTHIRARGAFHLTTNTCHFLTGDHHQKSPGWQGEYQAGASVTDGYNLNIPPQRR